MCFGAQLHRATLDRARNHSLALSRMDSAPGKDFPMRFRHNWILAIALLAANAQTTRAQEMPLRGDVEKLAGLQQPCMPGMQKPASAETNKKAMQHGSDQMA